MFTIAFKIAFLGVVFIYSYSSHYIFTKVYNTVQTVIDEEFHIQQGLAYCNFNFSAWHPKITTFPGLYFISAVILGPLKLCSTFSLRYINYVAGIFNLYLFFLWFYLSDTVKEYRRLRALFSAFNLSILPPLYFFTNIYYTDVISVTFISAMFVLNKIEHHIIATIFGVLAVSMRQTNIVWIGMLYADYVLKQFHYYWIKPRVRGRPIFEITQQDVTDLGVHSFRNLLRFNTIPKIVFYNMYSYFIPLVLFIAFVLVNRGIVIGDKTAHVAALHIPQLFYFSLFCLIFAWPHFVKSIMPFLSLVLNNISHSALILAIILVIVHFNSLVHPYLLADNRHYTFYIWMRFYENITGFRYFIAPVYFFAMFAIVWNVYSKHDVTFALVYLSCTIMVLVLQKMIEVRYFLIPFIILRVRIRCTSFRLLLLELTTYLCINIVTFSIFFQKNIYWNDFDYVQKIIW